MNDSIDSSAASVTEVLNQGSEHKKGSGKWWWLLLIILISAGAYYWFFMGQNGAQGSKDVTYLTLPASRADISVTVLATGNLEPLNDVQIGTELSGTVAEVLVEANDQVTKGQVLARLNTDQLEDTITKAKAALMSAESEITQAKAKITQADAGIRQSQAGIQKSQSSILQVQASQAQATAQVMQARSTANEARANYDRLQQLYQKSGGKIPSRSDLDASKATWDRAQAALSSAMASADSATAGISSARSDLASTRANDSSMAAAKITAEAALKSAEANVIQAQATLRSAETNLSKAIITAPIDGVVLSRSIEPGQTVASSLSAPTLFTIAEDLSKMELQVSVDEADVGQVKADLAATFTVDAWPGRKYEAKTTRVSLAADTSESVISYLTFLAVDNKDLSLRLGMTATASIETQSRKNSLRVPNTALRFTPPNADAGVADAASSAKRRPSDGDAASSTGGSFLSKLVPAQRGGNRTPRKQTSNTPAPAASKEQRVWVLEDGVPRPIKVITGITDGKYTEIVSGDLTEGMQVITQSTGGAS
jgi:HlyD family secretion protein